MLILHCDDIKLQGMCYTGCYSIGYLCNANSKLCQFTIFIPDEATRNAKATGRESRLRNTQRQHCSLSSLSQTCRTR